LQDHPIALGTVWTGRKPGFSAVCLYLRPWSHRVRRAELPEIDFPHDIRAAHKKLVGARSLPYQGKSRPRSRRRITVEAILRRKRRARPERADRIAETAHLHRSPEASACRRKEPGSPPKETDLFKAGIDQGLALARRGFSFSRSRALPSAPVSYTSSRDLPPARRRGHKPSESSSRSMLILGLRSNRLCRRFGPPARWDRRRLSCARCVSV